MSSRMRRPETAKLDITCGDWLLVKKHLTAGEQRAIFKRMMVMTPESGPQIDPIKVALSKMVAYLLDWSITDADDRPVVIRGQSEEVVIAALDNLDYDSFTEIKDAIEAHEQQMDRARAAEKNSQDGGSKSSVTSPSPVNSTGPTSTSNSSTLTSTPF